jgi:hypothetical protein
MLYTDDGESSPLDLTFEPVTTLTRRRRPYAALIRTAVHNTVGFRCFCELSELVHWSLSNLHSPGARTIVKDLLSTYTQYLDWYDQIPEVLKLGINFTPAVLFVQ